MLQDLRVGTVDEEVVRAHVVPEVVLFTKPQLRRVESYRTVQYNTSRDSSDLRVMAKVDLRENGESSKGTHKVFQHKIPSYSGSGGVHHHIRD